MDSLDEKIAAAKNAYERDGVALIPDVFTWQECQKMRAASLMALTRIDEIRMSGYPHGVLETVNFEGQSFPSLIFFPALVEGYLEAVRTDERLARIVRSFLGDEVKQLNNQFYYRMPGDGDTFAWHQDTYFRKPKEDYPSIDANNTYLQTIIAVDDFDEDNGAVEYILGSHKWGDINILEKREADRRSMDSETRLQQPNVPALRDYVRGDWEGKKMTMKAGGVLVWSGLIVHSSEENRSNRTRFAYMNGFAQANASKNWFHYLRGGVPQPMDTTLIP